MLSKLTILYLLTSSLLFLACKSNLSISNKKVEVNDVAPIVDKKFVVKNVSDAKTKINRNYYVEIDDSLILESVDKFIKFYHLNKDSVVIGLSIKKTNYRTILEISYDNKSIDNRKYYPSYYTLLNGYLVLLYSPFDIYVADKSKIKLELNSLVYQMGLQLSSKVEIFEPDFWTVVKCNNRIETIINLDYDEDVPCGYKQVVENGKILVVKDEKE